VMLARPLVRVARTGVAMTLLSGFLLFSVQPANYLSNTAFQIKLALMSLAVLNALIVHRLPQWQRALDTNSIQPVLVAFALLSLLLWILTIIAGRWIAFV
jgi:phosphatidylserine synthase